jgi:hypothetical protein
MLAVACAAGRPSHARQVKGDDPRDGKMAAEEKQRVSDAFETLLSITEKAVF